ncbi:Ig-like domain-containing protein [Pantoea sp. USHLN256]|uniref:Ig-like domain-containing protein n=1 Tax=Pantoea sp. USHLN256 TaxID=3081293 RepID=UPI003018EC2C
MTLNLTLLNDGVASQRVTLPQGKAFRLQAVAGNRYVITQGAEKTAAGPEHLLLKRKGKNLEIRQPGEDEPQLIIVDYYDLPGDVMGLDASGALHEYIHAADASIDADAFTDDQSAVMIMSRSSQGPVSAYSPLGDNGFLKAMAAFAGLLALGGGVLALQNQHSGKESPIPAPTIVQGHDERGGESASLQHGAVTGNAQPDISGQGSAPGNLIHIYSNGECLGSGVVAEDGSWKIKPLAMAEGRHQLTAVESTPQGKISAASVHFELHIDLTPPAVSLDNLADNVGSLTGDIPSGGLTNDTQPWLSGRSEPGAKIEITINGTVVGTAITDADGNWRFRTPVMEEGAQRISVTATDAVGNTSKPTADYRVEVDTQIAKPTISSITDAVDGGVTGAIANDGTGLTNDARPVLSGKVEAGSLITIYDGSTAIHSFVSTTSTWTWQFPADSGFSDGEHVLRVKAVDKAGNTSVLSDPFTINVDTQIAQPTISSIVDGVAGGVTGAITNDGTGLTNDNRPVLRGTTEAGSLITIFDGTTAIHSFVSTTSDWTWQYPTTGRFSDGEHVLRVQAVDKAGNTSVLSDSFTINVDTQVAQPTISSIVDGVAGGVTGAITNDGTGLTNDARPVLSGKVEAGSLITIYDGSTAIHSFVSTTSTWTWQFPTNGQFSDGEHVLRVKAVDKAGNTSVLSDPFTINVDTQIAQPTISSIVDGVAGGVTGAITNDGTGLTNDNRPVLRGTTEAGSLITIFDGTTAIHSFVSTTSDWTWQYPTTGRFSDGEHVLRVQAVDKAGNTSVLSDSFTINVDTQVAQPTISSIVDGVAGGVTGAITNDGTGLTNDNRPVLRGTTEAGSLITIYDGSTAIHSFVSTTSDWTWQYPTTGRFIDGEHVLRVQAVDKAGNTSVLSDPFTINVDTQIAQPTIASVTDAVAGGVTGAIANDGTGLTNDNRPRLSGTVEPGSLITIYDGTTAIHSFVSTTSDWTWQYPTTARFIDGEHVLRVQAVDKAGNTSVLSDPFTINVDTQIAQPSISSIVDTVAGGVTGAITNDGTGLTNDNRPVLNGTVEPGSTITIYDGNTLIHSFVVSGSTWTWQYPTTGRFSDGEHVLRVQAVDKAGNTSVLSDPFTINVDTQVAQPTISSIVDAVAGGVTGAITNDGTGLTNDNRPVLSGTVEPGSLITIYDGSTAIHSFVSTTSDWTWQYPTTTRFGDGEHVLRVQAIDKAGNTSTLSDPFTINVDTQIAQPTITSVTDTVAGGVTGALPNDGTGLTNDARPVLRGTTEAGSLITIYDGATAIHSFVSTTSDWTWQYPTTKRFSDSEHVLRVQAVDKAGNISALSDPFTINVDTSEPVAPVITIGSDNVGALTEAIFKGRITDDTTPTFSGTAEPNSVVYLYDNDNFLGSFQADGTGAWSWTLPELMPGLHNLTAYSRDAAGNKSAISEPYDFKLGTVWDFNDGTFNGWTILGNYTRPNDTFVRATAGGGYQLEFITASSTVDYGGDVMNLQINVQAGETYDFNFILSRITSYALINPAQLALTVDGVPVSSYYTVSSTPQKVEGSWVATTTGTVTLAINNRVSTGNGNDFWIDDIAIALHKEAEPSPAVSSLADAPAIASSEAAHQIDMNEQNLSTLSLNLQDVLSGGESDLFINDGKIQLKVIGEAGRELTLSDLMPDGSDSGEWNSVGNVKVAGVEYQVFQHSNQSAELLVQMGIHTTLDNH